MLTKSTTIQKLFLSFFILSLSSFALQAQEEEDSTAFETGRKLFFGIHAGVVKDFGKQANFFRGNGEFGIAELLAIPQIRSELYTRTGKNFYLNQYPDPMRYNVTISPGIDILYDAGDVNFILSASSAKLSTTGIFTLAATDPSNPYGDLIIKTESISGVERRTWLKLGAQFKSEINERNDFYIELAPELFFQKAVRNTITIEGSNYSILVQNPGNVAVRTSYTGYGLSGGLGGIARFQGNKMAQFGVNLSVSKLKMISSSGLNLMLEACLSLYL